MDLAFNLCNVAIFVAILVGTFLHHRRRFHVRMMVGCFVADLLLLLAVEFLPANSAVKQALEAAKGGGEDSTLLLVHVAFSVLSLALWIVQIVVGRQVLRGRMELLPRHKKGSRYFLVCRLGNVVTAFLI